MNRQQIKRLLVLMALYYNSGRRAEAQAVANKLRGAS